MLLACLLLACQKEDGITPGTGFENLYTIQDDPNDSIQHKRYELYTTYGVPVFFNDTIGKVFVKTDVNGDSVFRYETLDLNWAFSGTNSGSVTYQVTRLTDPGLMMKSLRFAEIFLKNSQQALNPYALWLTEKCYQLSSAGVEQKEIISRYRNLMFSWINQINEEDMLEKAAGYRNEIVKLKVQNYSDELNAFNNMLDESLYDKNWGEFYPDERIPYWRSSASLQIWFPWPLVEEWEQDSSYRKEMMTYGNVYVAQVAMGADPNQLIKAVTEAVAYPGPSIIIAYTPCISHGIRAGMNCVQEEMKTAVEAGFWTLYRYNPMEKSHPLTIDSKKPTGDYKAFLRGESRFAALEARFPEIAQRLFTEAEQDVTEQYEEFLRLETCLNR